MLLTYLRSFLAVIEEGSINRAAARLQLSQPALSRQMQALEQLVGGPLFERGSGGVRATSAGLLLSKKAQGILQSADAALEETRQLALGLQGQLKIGCLMSAALPYMSRALRTMYRTHPEVKTTMHDLTPGEMIARLRRGELDAALIGQEGNVLGREFYMRRLARLGVVAVLPECHALAGREKIRLRELSQERFIGCPDEDLPGRNQWIVTLCRKAGFRPRFVREGGSLAEVFSLVVSEPAVTLVPEYLRTYPYAGVSLVKVEDSAAVWDLLFVWQRGKRSAALTVLLNTLEQTTREATAVAGSEPETRSKRTVGPR